MARAYRVIALGFAGLLAAGVAVNRVQVKREAAKPAVPPPTLAANRAKAVEVAFTDTLRRGETLSQLMQRTRLDADARAAMLAELARVQDPRSVRPGLVVEYRKATRDGRIRGMFTRLDADRNLSFHRTEGA